MNTTTQDTEGEIVHKERKTKNTPHLFFPFYVSIHFNRLSRPFGLIPSSAVVSPFRSVVKRSWLLSVTTDSTNEGVFFSEIGLNLEPMIHRSRPWPIHRPQLLSWSRNARHLFRANSFQKFAIFYLTDRSYNYARTYAERQLWQNKSSQAESLKLEQWL